MVPERKIKTIKGFSEFNTTSNFRKKLVCSKRYNLIKLLLAFNSNKILNYSTRQMSEHNGKDIFQISDLERNWGFKYS